MSIIFPLAVDTKSRNLRLFVIMAAVRNVSCSIDMYPFREDNLDLFTR
jgi:hypothetical protein